VNAAPGLDHYFETGKKQVIEKIQPLLKVNEFKDVHEAIVAATEFLKKL
jgi:hypothetical protein